MADVNANIGINIDASNALAQLKNLQREISQFHTSIAKSSEAAALAQANLQKNFLNSINALGGFSAELRSIKTSAESFTTSLEKNQFSMREYFRYAGGATKTFGNLFRAEFDTIGKVAEDRVKKLQTQYIKMGRDASGQMKAIAVMPTELNLQDKGTQLQLAAQKQAIFNQLVHQGATNLLNFGKNTQWAGRQLMVGFTLPLMTFGSVASQAFMQMESAALKFKKVYGDLGTTPQEAQQQLTAIQELAKGYTQYGVAASATVQLAADAAAAGFKGVDLQRQTAEATRLSVLGQIDSQKALETTISLQNAFNIKSQDLANTIDFLNAVENQTVTSLDDITTAIPKVAPVINQLGGNVKDLAFFLTAMKQGGVNASEGANALKSGLASLINPTKKASDMLASVGINVRGIVEADKGNLKKTVIDFANALNTLDPISRARAIEQMFGKFQFARISTLLNNVTQQGTQAAKVMDLANASAQDLANLSQQELGTTSASAMMKFKKAIEDMKLALVPVGQTFLQAVTPIIHFVSGILQKFNNLSDGTKKFITLLTVGIGAAGPVLLMTFGLLANGIANIIKLFLTLRGGYERLTGGSKVLGEQTQYLTSEQLDAAAVAHSLDQSHAKLIQTFNIEAESLAALTGVYQGAVAAASRFAAANPGAMVPPKFAKKYANGVSIVPGSGSGDIIPAMLTPGEAIIPKEMASRYAPLINGMIAGNIPGFANGLGFGDIKKTVGLYKAPSSVMAQSSSKTWETAQAEIEAVANKARELGATENQVLNLLKKQASHIEKDVSVLDIGGKTTEIKNWKARNLVADMGYVNNYVNVLQSSSTILENFKKSNLDVVSKDLGISMEDLNKEIDRLQQGLHPVTRQSAQVLQKIAQSDPGYQGQAAAAGLGARLAGSFYETIPSRAYDPKYDESAARSTASKIARFRTRVGQLLGQQATSAVAMGAKTASASKETIIVGEDVGLGLEVGMKNKMQAVAVAGEKLGATATGGVSEGASGRKGRRIATWAGGTPPSIAMSAATEELAAAPQRASNLFGRLNERLNNTNGLMGRLGQNFTGITFGLTALGGAAQMAGGKIGAIGSAISQISGILFGISAMKNLFSGTAIARLFAPLAGAVLPLTAAVVATVAIIKVANYFREKERQAIEGVGKAANLSATQIEKLGQAAGFTPIKTSLALTPTIAGVNTQQRSQVETIKQSMASDKEFQNNIKTLKSATKEQADIIFKSMSVQLAGSGASAEAITNIITALREQAKRTDLKFDFKKIDISTAEGAAGMQASVDKVLNKFSEQFKTGYSKSIQSFGGKGFAGTIVSENLSKGLKTALSTASNVLSADISGMKGQLEAGKISAKQFGESFDGISKSILKLPKAEAVYLISNTLKNLAPDMAKSVTKLKDLGAQMTVIEALGLGIEVTAKDIDKLNSAANGPKSLADLKKQIAERMAIAAQAASDLAKINGQLTIPDTIKNTNALKDQRDQILQQITAYQKLKAAHIDNKTAIDISGNAEMAKQIVNAKSASQMKILIGYIKEYTKAQEKLAKLQETPVEKNLNRLTNLQNMATLYERIIDAQSAPKIKAYNDEIAKQEKLLQGVNDKINAITTSQINPLQAQIDLNNYALEGIALKEDVINKSYDTQIAALDKVATINQDIANIQQQRMTIADALTRGDISAAAKAVQDARAQQTQSAIQTQKDALTAGKDSQIAALGRVALEKQNRELQYQIATVQQTQLKTLELQKTAIETQLTSTQRMLTDFQATVQAQKDTAMYAGMTKTEIDTSIGLIQAGQPFADTYAITLSNSATSAKKMADSLWSAVNAQIALTNAKSASSAGITKVGKTGLNYGGLVPQYLASGGYARGTDTVPAMLTPGEFVVNRAATQLYKPLLQQLNASQYPSMLGANSAGAMAVVTSSSIASDNSSAVYNYHLGFNINGTSSSPQDIAREVMTQIRQIDSQRIRGKRV